MKTSKLVIIILAAVIGSLAAGGAAAWYLLPRNQAADSGETEKAPPPPPKTDLRANKYVSLEKVIVMLQSEDDPVPHYLALDVVFTTPEKESKVMQDQLPLLRSVTVETLSGLSMQAAQALSVPELASLLNGAYRAVYANDLKGTPFTDAKIGKLIIE